MPDDYTLTEFGTNSFKRGSCVVSTSSVGSACATSVFTYVSFVISCISVLLHCMPNIIVPTRYVSYSMLCNHKVCYVIACNTLYTWSCHVIEHSRMFRTRGLEYCIKSIVIKVKSVESVV